MGVEFSLWRPLPSISPHEIFYPFRDTAGQERFKTITTAYYRGAMVWSIFLDKGWCNRMYDYRGTGVGAEKNGEGHSVGCRGPHVAWWLVLWIEFTGSLRGQWEAWRGAYGTRLHYELCHSPGHYPSIWYHRWEILREYSELDEEHQRGEDSSREVGELGRA